MRKCIIVSFVVSFALGAVAGGFSITAFGAKEGGAKCTDAFTRAIAACAEAGGGRVVVPSGRWFSGAIRLKSNVELHLEEGAEILFSQDPNDYLPAVPTSWEGMECWNYCPLVYAYCCTNVAVTGVGTLRAYDGEWRDTKWYPWVWQENGIRDARRQLYDWGATDYPVEKRQIWKMENANTRPHFVQFNRCKDVRWESFKVRNSPFWTLHLYLCEDVEVRGLDVCAHGNNNDGIDIEMCRNVLVENCTFDQGDDGVVIKSGRNRDAWRLHTPTENVLVRNCRIANAHTVFGIGSEISGGVKNVRMENCTADTVGRVVYIKTNRRRGGVIENVSVDGISCRESTESVFEIAMDVLYEWAKLPEYETALTSISNVSVRNISCEKAACGIRISGDRLLKPRNVDFAGWRIGRASWRWVDVANVESLTYDGLPLLVEPKICHGRTPFPFSAYDEVFARVVRADRAADAAWLACDTPEKAVAHGAELRAKAITALGGFPPKCDLRPQVTGIVAKDGYRVEKVLFESRPNFHVTAHLFLPDPACFSAPYPAVVVPCGHDSMDAKRGAGYQQAGVLGAKAGLAVLIYDPIDQGERRQKRDDEKEWSSVHEHNAVGVRAALLGWNTAQFRLWDGMRAIDYLETREEIDRDRIGVMGMSGGGALSAYINAFDPRIKAGAPAGFLSTIRDVYDNCGPQDAEQQFFGELGFGLNHLGLVCMRAPSPTMMVCTRDDFFPLMGSLATYERAKRVFAVAGKADQVRLMEADGPHGWYTSTKTASVNWMRRWLCGDDAVIDDRAFRRLDPGVAYTPENSGVTFDAPETYNVTPNGRVLDLPNERSAYDILRDELAVCGKERPTPEIVREATGIRSLQELKYMVLPSSKRTATAVDGTKVASAVLSRDDDQIMIPVVVCRPVRGGPGAPVLVVSDDDNHFRLAGTIKRILAEGRVAAVADLRGFGETARSKHSFYGSPDADEEIAVLMYALGDSLVARRAEDALVAADYVAKIVGKNPMLHAEGRAVIPATHAMYLSSDAIVGIETARAPQAWREVLKNETLSYPFANIICGALRNYDWIDLLPR